MTTPIISISNLNKAYQKTPVLQSLNWQIQSGDIVALLGKNGAGKSTLLETIMHLRDSDQGEINLWGQNWKSLPQSQREKIAFVSQEISGFEWMRVTDFLTYLGGFFPGWDQNYCEQLQSRWGLNPTQRVGALSGGQSQIMHVIQALSTRPELMILDEPVAHLDPNMRRQFLAELIELSCEFNSTVIFSSHIVSDLERVANKVALLLNGQIQHYYEVDELKSSIAHVKFSCNGPLQQTAEFSQFINWHERPNGATATFAVPESHALENLKSVFKGDIETIPMSLEDWYLEISHAAN